MSKDKLQEIKRQYELREAGVFLDNNDVKELMKLSYNQALVDFSIGITKYEYDYKNINELLTKLKIK